MYYDFLIRQNVKEKGITHLLSPKKFDFVTHFGNDVYLAWN